MKFNVKDADGNEFTVEEVEKTTETEKVDPVETHDDDATSLSSDEIAALKGLAAVADKLVALANTGASDGCGGEGMDDSDDDDEDDEDDTIVDTDKADKPAKKVGDARASVGSLEKKQKRATDSVETDAVADAWAKRYNGGK